MRIKANYFSSKNYAEILNNINIDIGNMTSVADEGVFFVVTQAFSMVGGIIGLFYLRLQNDTHGTSFYSGKSGYYETFCKEAKKNHGRVYYRKRKICRMVWRYCWRCKGSKAFWNTVK